MPLSLGIAPPGTGLPMQSAATASSRAASLRMARPPLGVPDSLAGRQSPVSTSSGGQTTASSSSSRLRHLRTASAATDTLQQQQTQQGYSADGLDVVKSDADLGAHADHLKYRWGKFMTLKKAIEAAEGSLADFALGHKKLGFTRENGGTVYREWAPAAQAACLIGDFNNWQQTAWMTRDQWGVWEVRLPDGPDGKPAIPHGSRVKIHMQHPHGHWLDRLPAYISWATIPQGVMGAKYDGIYWNPPENERYRFKHPKPRRPRSLRIYEAHVGMSGEDGKVATYAYFRDSVLPRIKATGYTAIQLMAVQEHAYYASFGYHVTNPFAVSSRSGTPEELKSLVDAAHGMGLVVLLDAVHSHISSNADDGLAGFDMGQREEDNYFLQGPAGYHSLWDSRVLNYSSWETLRYLLSNLRWWMDEFGFDGFRFDGVTSMLYQHHGINRGFSGAYHEYFGFDTNVDACVYLMLANELVHTLSPDAVTIAEDVSGMPTLCRPVREGGIGFDMRLAMAIPDKWIKLLKHTKDESWSMTELVSTLCNRRYSELTVGYAESHDQALVGDQTVAFRLMGPEMYSGMSALDTPTAVIERGIALHKMIRLVTMALGGEAYLNFMGNEFGHPEWIDFPREGNQWSGHYARRQWSLADQDHLRYKHLLAWDAAMMALDDKHDFLSNKHQWVTHMDNEQQVLVFERGPLLFVFNWSPVNDYEGLKVATPCHGKWRVALDSDAWDFGGKGRVGHDVDHFTQPSEAVFHDRYQYMQVLAPARTAVVYYRVDEEQERRAVQAAAGGTAASAQQQQRRQDEERARAEAEARRAAEAQALGPRPVQLVQPEENTL